MSDTQHSPGNVAYQATHAAQLEKDRRAAKEVATDQRNALSPRDLDLRNWCERSVGSNH